MQPLRQAEQGVASPVAVGRGQAGGRHLRRADGDGHSSSVLDRSPLPTSVARRGNPDVRARGLDRWVDVSRRRSFGQFVRDYVGDEARSRGATLVPLRRLDVRNVQPGRAAVSRRGGLARHRCRAQHAAHRRHVRRAGHRPKRTVRRICLDARRSAPRHDARRRAARDPRPVRIQESPAEPGAVDEGERSDRFGISGAVRVQWPRRQRARPLCGRALVHRERRGVHGSVQHRPVRTLGCLPSVRRHPRQHGDRRAVPLGPDDRDRLVRRRAEPAEQR